MMEKYDGIRVYWDGKSLRSKDLKHVFHIPDTYGTLPSIPFEGELW
jgi:hypothetical protein